MPRQYIQLLKGFATLITCQLGFAQGLETIIQFEAGEFHITEFRVFTGVNSRKLPTRTFKFKVANYTDSTWVDPEFAFILHLPASRPELPPEKIEFTASTKRLPFQEVIECEVPVLYPLAGRTPGSLEMSFLGGTRILSPDAQTKADKLKAAAWKHELTRLSRLPILTSGGLKSAFVAADPQCALEYQSAARSRGLTLRKKLAELLAYGCGFITSSGVHVSISQPGQMTLISIEEGPDVNKKDWVPHTWLRVPVIAK